MGRFFQMPCDHFCSTIPITCYLHMIVALVSLPKKHFTCLTVLISALFLLADAIIPITCAILVFLFALQHYGTHRVGFLFAPIVLSWLLCMSGIGLYNIIHWNPHVYRALNPSYMITFLKKTRKSGWMSLGGILLCMTGKAF